jgi:hypothetical protein
MSFYNNILYNWAAITANSNNEMDKNILRENKPFFILVGCIIHWLLLHNKSPQNLAA